MSYYLFFSYIPSQTLSPYLAGSLGQTRSDILDGNLVYDPQMTYISLLVGDGDNIAFMRGGRRGWMKERLTYCQQQVGSPASSQK